MSRADGLTVPAGHPSSIDPGILEEAADWLVRLEGGALNAEECRELEAWQARSPEHQRAWLVVLDLKQLIGTVPGALGRAVLERRRAPRRAMLKSLAGLFVAAPVGWMAYRYLPWEEWSADYRTATGERREVALPDGSRLLLNTASAVDQAFSAEARRLILHQGEILVETAPDSTRPFIVRTEQGEVRSLGTRFNVRGDGATTTGAAEVAVLEHGVAIRPAQGAGVTVLKAGEQVTFTDKQVGRPTALTRNATAWTRGQIVADGWRLEALCAELARYRPGILRCDPAVADLRISGVFQMGDTDRALRIVAETLSVRISAFTPYWVSIDPES